MKFPQKHANPHLAACLLAAAFPLSAFAATRAYIGGNNSIFGTSTNWNPNGTPGSGDVLTLGSSSIAGLSGDLNVTLNGVYTGISSVTFDSSALPGAFIITETGGTLGATTETLTGAAANNAYNLTQGSANTVATLNLAGDASSNDLYTVAGTGSTLTVTGTLYLGLAGTGTLTQSGGIVDVHNSTASAFLVIGSNSNSSGTYNLNGGTLTADFLDIGAAGASVFNQTAGSLTVNANAVIACPANSDTAVYNYSGGTATFTGGLSVGIKGFFNLQTGGSLPFDVTVNANGTFNLAGGSFGTGNVILNGGTLQLMGHSITYSSHITGTGTIQNGSSTAATLTLSPATSDSFAGIIADGPSAALSVTLTTDNFTLSGSNTYSGTTTIQAGALAAGADNSLSGNSPVNLTGGSLNDQTYQNTIPSLTGAAGSSVNINSTGNLTIAQTTTTTYSGSLTGSGTLTKSLAGTLILSNVSSYSGALSATGGTLILPNTVAATSLSASNGGTLQLQAASLTTPATVNATGGAITQSGAASLTIGAASGNASTLTIGTAGTFTTGTGNTYINATGQINLTAGTLNVNGSIAVTGGSLTQTGGTFTWAAAQTMLIQSGGTVSLVNGYTTPANALINVTGSGSKLSQTTNALQINNGATLSVNSAASVFSNIFCVASIYSSTTSNTGNGTVTVDGANSSLVGNFSQCFLGIGGVGSLTFSGSATGSFFGFYIGTYSTAGDNGTLSVESNATVTSTSVIRVAAGAASGTGAINLTGGTLTQTGTTSVFIGSTSLSTGTVTIATGGTFTTGTGAITVNKTGTLTLQSGGTLNANGNLTNSGTVSLSGTQSWAASTTFTNSAGTATFNTDPGSSSSSPLSLVINGGTVLLNGTQHLNSIALNAGTLGGHGTILGPLTLGSSSRTIAPSATLASTSTGTLTLNSLTTTNKTTLQFNLVTPLKSAPNGSDLINVAGANGLTLGSGTTISVNVSHATGGASTLGYYEIMQYNGTLGGNLSSVTLPAAEDSGNVVYTLDSTHDNGFIDIHRSYLGDVDDSGFVDINDLATLALNWQQAGGWSQGNFLGDPTVDINDLSVLALHWQTGIAAFGEAADSLPGTSQSFQDAVASMVFGASVPEPTSLSLLALATLPLLHRRRPVR